MTRNDPEHGGVPFVPSEQNSKGYHLVSVWFSLLAQSCKPQMGGCVVWFPSESVTPGVAHKEHAPSRVASAAVSF